MAEDSTVQAEIDRKHDYVSTACHHNLHDHCRRVCKFCDQPCGCVCHVNPPAEPMPLHGQSDPTGGDGHLPGAWDEVRSAYLDGHISATAYDALRRALPPDLTTATRVEPNR